MSSSSTEHGAVPSFPDVPGAYAVNSPAKMQALPRDIAGMYVCSNGIPWGTRRVMGRRNLVSLLTSLLSHLPSLANNYGGMPTQASQQSVQAWIYPRLSGWETDKNLNS